MYKITKYNKCSIYLQAKNDYADAKIIYADLVLDQAKLKNIHFKNEETLDEEINSKLKKYYDNRSIFQKILDYIFGYKYEEKFLKEITNKSIQDREYYSKIKDELTKNIIKTTEAKKNLRDKEYLLNKLEIQN